MSRIKNFLMDVEELYRLNFTPQQIADRLNTDLNSVNDAIHYFCGPTEDYEFYEDDENGNS